MHELTHHDKSKPNQTKPLFLRRRRRRRRSVEMKGTLQHELEVGLPADRVWEVYRGTELGRLVVELLPGLFEKVEVLEGDGGAGSLLLITLNPALGGPRYYKEKIVKVEEESRVKEAAAVEGGYLEFGFVSYMVRFEIVDKGAAACAIRSTIEYELHDVHAANAALATTDTVAAIAEATSSYIKSKMSQT